MKFTNIWLQYKINVCIDQLDNTVNKYNITCDSTIKIKSVDVKIIKYLDFCIENNDKDPKFKVGDDVRILIFFFFPNTLQMRVKKFLWLKKLKALCLGHMLLVILMVKKLLEHFAKKNFKKQI